MRTANKALPLVAGFAAALIVLAVSAGVLFSAKKELSSLRAVSEEMLALRQEYLPVSGKVRALEGRMNLTRAQGVGEALDEVLEPLGLKGKVKYVKPLASDEASGEKAEVDMKGLSMNEMVNVLYNLENAPMLLVIKKISMKTSFEKPDLLDLTMTVSFIKPPPK